MIKAAPTQRVAKLTRAVGCQDDIRNRRGDDRSKFGNGDLEIGQHFQQIGFELFVGAVDLINQQNRWRRHADGFEQGAFEQKVPLENMIFPFRRGQVFIFRNFYGEQLPLVIPFVDGGLGVEAFVTLKPDQRTIENLRQAFADLGFADTGIAFQQQRSLQPVHQGQRRGELRVGDVSDLGEAGEYGVAG